MFQKIAPLLILLIFAIGTYFVIQGLEKASAMSKPPVKNTERGVK